MLFAALICSSSFIRGFFTAYLIPKGIKIQHGITGHDTVWHQILRSGHSPREQMESIGVFQSFREPLKTPSLGRSTFPAKP